MRAKSFFIGVLLVSTLTLATAVGGPGFLMTATEDQPAKNVLDPGLANASGPVEIVVQLDDPPLAVAHGKKEKNVRRRKCPAF